MRLPTLMLILAAFVWSPAYADVDRSRASEIIKDWPKVSKDVANAMMEKYGPPNEATVSMLIWRNNGPWKRTIVYSEPVDHVFPMPHKDVLQQFIAYKVPSDKFDELAAYDGSVIAERTNGEISARCDKEAANFLALNLANDIVTGKKSVEEARQTYADSIKALMNGEKPPYTQGLQFEVQSSYKGDPGEQLIEKPSK